MLYNRHEELGCYEGEYPLTINVALYDGDMVKYAPESGAVYTMSFLRIGTIAPNLPESEVAQNWVKREEWIEKLPSLIGQVTPPEGVTITLSANCVDVDTCRVGMFKSVSDLFEGNFEQCLNSMIIRIPELEAEAEKEAQAEAERKARLDRDFEDLVAAFEALPDTLKTKYLKEINPWERRIYVKNFSSSYISKSSDLEKLVAHFDCTLSSGRPKPIKKIHTVD